LGRLHTTTCGSKLSSSCSSPSRSLERTSSPERSSRTARMMVLEYTERTSSKATKTLMRGVRRTSVVGCSSLMAMRHPTGARGSARLPYGISFLLLGRCEQRADFSERRQHEVRRISLPKLFGKEPEASRTCVFVAKRRLICYTSVSPRGLRGPDSGLVPNFQTVSPRTPLNKGI
jgi:hypothetical protein